MSLSLKFQNQIFFTVARIVIKSETSAGASIGTGFIIKIKIDETHTSHLLITNRHVLSEKYEPIDLIFHCNNGGTEPALDKFKPVRFQNYEKYCYFHSKKEVDLAALNLSSLTGEKDLYWKHLYEDILIDFEKDEVLAGEEVWFIGYPENRFDTVHNLPLLRKGFISSLPKVDFNGRPEVVIDAQVFPGSSGSPVFTVIKGTAKLLGVVSQTMIKNNQLQTVPTKHVEIVQEVLGLGIVIKSSVLKEFIKEIASDIKSKL